MGITATSLQRINKYLKPESRILIVGCQNMYNTENYDEVAEDYFRRYHHIPRSIDITGCQGAAIVDLRERQLVSPMYEAIFQHGTVEHIDGQIYQAFNTFHHSCLVDGIMIHENPMTGNWPGHGQHYFTEEFYVELAKACKYELLEVCSEAAMGNTTDGWNICAVLRKVVDNDFITEENFNEIYAEHIRSK